MDPKGMRSGFEIELMKQITSLTNVQVINCGGCWKVEHIVQLWDKADVSAAACALIFRCNLSSIAQGKKDLRGRGIEPSNRKGASHEFRCN